MNAIRMQIEIAADTAADSALAEFHQELFRQYDILMIDTSYGSGDPSVENLQDHLENYMNRNLTSAGLSLSGYRDFTKLSLSSLNVTGTRFAADEDGTPLREQIYAYMSAEPVEELMDKVLSNVDRFNGLGLDLTAWDRKKAENEESLREALTSKSGDSSEESEKSEELQKAEGFAVDHGLTAEQLKNPCAGVDGIRRMSILRQVMAGNETDISNSSVDTGNYLSHRGVHQGDGLSAENSHHYPEADAIIFDQYVFEKCGSYRNPMEKGVLKYQLEYLLFGENSDRDNLEKTVRSLFLTRLAANFVFLLSDGSRTAEAGTWAGVIAVLLLSPELEEVLKTALLLAWSYTETLQDMKTLMAGGRIPLVKSGSTWKTSLTAIFTPGISTHAESGGEGLNYEDYIRILLFLENGSTKNVRLMDLMEMDIRTTEGNANFQMDWCLDTFSMEAEVQSSFGYSYSIRKEVTYD